MRITNYLVSYKYVKTMAPVIRSRSYFLKSVTSKWQQIRDLKLELHVSPFYIWNNQFIFQPVFDFDGPTAKVELENFLGTYTSIKSPDWCIEYSGQGLHLFSTVGYYSIKTSQVSDLRNTFRDRLKQFSHLDITSSIRDLPIRRLPSVSSNGTFVMQPYSTRAWKEAKPQPEITEMLVYDWLKHYTLPTRFEPVSVLFKIFR